MKDEKTSLSDKIKGNTLLMDEKTKLIDENYVLQKKKTKDLAILKKVLFGLYYKTGSLIILGVKSPSSRSNSNGSFIIF